jgi:cytochrome b involved in lipid metabolism
MVNFKMPRGPNSLVGNAPKPEERDGEYVSKKALRSAAGSVSLRVVANAEADGLARLHPACPLLADADDRGVVLLVLEAGSDCVLRACAASDESACPAGCLALSEEQRINVHVAEDQTASFKAFEPPRETSTDLFDIELEVRLLRRGGSPSERRGRCDEDDDEDDEDDDSDVDSDADSESSFPGGECVVDGVALRASLRHRLRDCWVAAGELLCVEAVDTRDPDTTHVLRARVASVNSVDPASAAALFPGYHCFRGAFSVEDTKMYVHAEEGNGFNGFRAHHRQRSGDASDTTPHRALTVLNQNPRDDSERRAASLQKETIAVVTSDGETFPVHRSLLRPCVALTRHVREAAPGGIESSGKRAQWERENENAFGLLEKEKETEKETISTTSTSFSSEHQTNSVRVPIDCERFDKVLLWLERESLGLALPEYDVHTAEALVGAADALGLASLADACRASLGAHESRITTHAWKDVVAHNRGGGVRVVVDGMVLDVKRWLPEHPGGDRIIPAQSVNVDATRHFELYHSSKESFLYLRAFYVGEIVKEDVDSIPRVVNQVTGAIDPPASQAFLDQLREYTRGFRIDNTKERAHVRAHLGVRS